MANILGNNLGGAVCNQLWAPDMVDKWRIIVHLSYFNKVEYQMDSETMAHEYAAFIMERGCRVVDSRGVETYFPIHAIQKVKVVPPGVELSETITIWSD